MIRGVAQRSICDRDRDARSFFDRVGGSVDRGEIRVAAYCLMPNHAHLIVRGPAGGLGDAMRNIEGSYVVGFNRPRGRKGHLFQSRYKAKPIRSIRYMTAAIAYIDLNPVEAGLVATPADFPHSSARFYARTAGPPWLDRSWVEAYLRAGLHDAAYSPARYARAFGMRTSAGARRWFVSAMESPLPDTPAIEELIAASPEWILRWMEERARSADGTGRTLPPADAETLTEAVSALPEVDRERQIGAGNRKRPLGRVLLAGLLWRLAGEPLRRIGVQMGLSTGGARSIAVHHDRLLVADDGYRELAGQVCRAALDACHPRLQVEP